MTATDTTTRIAHELTALDLHDVSRTGAGGIVPVRCLPPHQRVLTVLAPAGTLVEGDEVIDRGVTVRVCGRAPWADDVAAGERPDLAATHEAWTMHRVLGGQVR